MKTNITGSSEFSLKNSSLSHESLDLDKEHKVDFDDTV